MSSTEVADLKRRIERLAAERVALFAHGTASTNLSANDRTRLKTIERELDECFLELRRSRAARDAYRFAPHNRLQRNRIEPRPPT